MRLRALLPAAFLVLVALPMRADTTYTYYGNAFDSFSPSPPTPNQFSAANSITGYVVLSMAIPGDVGSPGTTVAYDPYIVSYSFTDGVDTISNTSPGPGAPIFTVSTDSAGNIIAWNYDFSLFSGPDVFGNYGDHGLGFSGHDGALDTAYEYGGNSTPGYWKLTAGPGPTVTPEPGTLALLGTGLAGAAAMLRRRVRKA